MSGRPYTYGRAMAIAQLMRDMRRPVLKEMVEKKDYLNTVYLHGEDLYVSYSDTIDWVPKLTKLTKYGRWSSYLTAEQIAAETPDRKQFPAYPWDKRIKEHIYFLEPIKGWPTEEEIAAEIAESAEREKAGGGLSVNDISAFNRMIG